MPSISVVPHQVIDLGVHPVQVKVGALRDLRVLLVVSGPHPGGAMAFEDLKLEEPENRGSNRDPVAVQKAIADFARTLGAPPPQCSGPCLDCLIDVLSPDSPRPSHAASEAPARVDSSDGAAAEAAAKRYLHVTVGADGKPAAKPSSSPDRIDTQEAVYELSDALKVQLDAARVDGYALEQRRYARALALHYVARCDHAKPDQPTPRSLGTACVACITEALLGQMRAWTPVPQPGTTAPAAMLNWVIDPPAPGEKYRKKTARISHADVQEQLAGGKDLQLEVEVFFEKPAPATDAPGARTVSPPKPEPTAPKDDGSCFRCGASVDRTCEHRDSDDAHARLRMERERAAARPRPLPLGRPPIEFADQFRMFSLGTQIVRRGDGSQAVEVVEVTVKCDHTGRQLSAEYSFWPPPAGSKP